MTGPAPKPGQLLAGAPIEDALIPIIRWLAVAAPFAAVLGKSPADIACSSVAALFLIRAILRRDFSWARQDWFIAALAVWGYLILRALAAPDLGYSLTHALPFIRYLLFAAALQTLVLAQAVWRKRIAMSAAAGLSALMADALLQAATGKDLTGRHTFEGRLTAYYHGPRVGIMLAWLSLPPLLTFIDWKRFGLAAGFGALALITILLSGDRMAFLLMLLYACLFGLFIRRARIYVLLVLLAISLIAALFFAAQPRSFQRQVLSTVEIIKTLPKTHYGQIWTSAIKIARDHPLFGAGPGAFRKVCTDEKYGPLIYPQEDHGTNTRCATHPHNIYLEWLSETGAIGLGLFLILLSFLLRDYLKGMKHGPPDWTYAGLFVLFVARLWPLTSQTSFYHAWSAVPFWLVVGWGLAYARPPETRP